MERWTGRVAIVTGASSGIGAAIAEFLVKNGMKVIGVARRIERLEEAAKKLGNEEGCLIPYECDLTKHELIGNIFQMADEKYGGVDVLVNNAGASTDKSLLEMSTDNIKFQLDLNVTALTLGTQFAIKSMRKRNVEDGHVINISSILAYSVASYPQLRFYSATKFAVRAIAEGFRHELRSLNSGIKVSCISPGLVATEFTNNCAIDARAEKIMNSIVPIAASDIADAVKYVLEAPSRVEMDDIILSTCLKK